jgi:hypothetical protein
LPQHEKQVESHTSEALCTEKVRNTLNRALKSGELLKAFEEDRWSILQQKMQGTLSAAASTGALTSIFQETCESKAQLPEPASVQPDAVQLDAVSAPKFRTTCVATF